MSRRAELEQRLRRLEEISGILSAMKTMALIETKKFGRFMTQQQRLVDSIEAAAADFLGFHRGLQGSQPAPADAGHIVVLIGSERGFCGDFNETLIAALGQTGDDEPRLIVIGRRLASKLAVGAQRFHALAGANVAEEVPAVLDALIDALRGFSESQAPWSRLSVLAHEPAGEVTQQALLPIVPPIVPPAGFPPRLNLEPARFFSDLIEHYLAAKLPALFYGSLMAENRRRLEHMETALNRMQARMDEIARTRNTLRQEEITEQIEIILLSTDAVSG